MLLVVLARTSRNQKDPVSKVTESFTATVAELMLRTDARDVRPV